MAGLVRLEWQKDSRGYEIVPRERRGRTIAGGLEDESGDPRQPWDTPEAWSHYIRPKGGEPKTFVLEGVENNLFLKLANTRFTFDGVRAFVNDWGLPLSRWDGTVYWVFLSIANLRTLGNMIAERRWADLERALTRDPPERSGLARSEVQFRRLSGDSTPRVFLQPENLVGFCELELIQLIEFSELRPCQNCGAFLFVRVKGRRGPQQQHCSTTCRVAMHRKGQRASRARARAKR